MDQPMLFQQDMAVYEPDRFVYGSGVPLIKHPDHENSQMRKPFIFWDGEGYTDEWGQHHYWLLANSLGDKCIAPVGRSLERSSIARMFMRSQTRYPEAINVGFSLGYDYTCILRSNGLPSNSIKSLYDKQYLTSAGHIWSVHLGKKLEVFTDGNAKEKFKLEDVWGFFQRSFVKALDEYFDGDWPYRDIIVEMKSQRAHFDRNHDDEVMRYNDYELELGVLLMEELRNRLYDAGMPISEWYGPGALANGLFQRWKVKETLVDLYDNLPEISDATRYAYAGGRFELLQCGHINSHVYQYDINSAYPWAIAQLPNLSRGSWEHVVKPSWKQINHAYTLVRCTVDYDSDLNSLIENVPFPLWRRSPQGRISYPSNEVQGWFWYPELAAAARYCRALGAEVNLTITVHEAYVFHEANPDDKPLHEVAQLYHNRQVLKKMGNGAHVGIKLGLNSLYGKFAQQVGWMPGKNKPAYHNLAHAGWVTAMCRAKIISAMALDPDAVIATETDAVFSTRPLDLYVSTDLGAWDLTEYDDMYYFASGFRFGFVNGEVKKPATRGIPVKDISLQAILDQCKDQEHVIEVMQQQFISFRWAVSQNHPEQIGQWKYTPKQIRLMAENPVGKRLHDPMCASCSNYTGLRLYHWDRPHTTIPNPDGMGRMNAPHKVAWVDTNAIDITEREMESGSLFDLATE